MTAEEYASTAQGIPSQPGIYKYFDHKNVLLYVGKAKNLRKRTGSYFSKTFTSYKTHELVKKIHHIEFTIVNNEQDAFLLENTLIKENQPRYNINLKDDKTYPYIVIKKEPFPRIFLTRRQLKDGSQYLGPFTSVGKVRELLEFIRQHIPLRTCSLNLTETNIQKKKFKVCLEYHLGNCKGPCEGYQDMKDYQEGLLQVKNLLKGNLYPVIRHYREEMKLLVDQLAFEEADKVRKKLEHLENYQSRSGVVNPKLGTVDVYSILQEDDTAYVNYMAVSNGAVIQTKTIILEKKLEETSAEVLSFAVAQLRSTFPGEATEIIIPFQIEYPEKGIRFTVPVSGDKKKLLELSEKNVNYFQEELKRKKILRLEEKTGAEKNNILEQLQKDLHLPQLPVHIECFDNSNFQGSFPVSAMVSFKNGLPDKSQYRKFNVKTVKGINDFATMKEVVFRRYKRLTEEGRQLPQLVIIDGGKGQLSSAMESIHDLKLDGKLSVVGLAKNEEEIFFSGDTQSVRLPWDSDSLKLLRRIRDEVHRFGINFHRQQRSKAAIKNELEQIRGIGKTLSTSLLTKYRSVKKIKELSEKELASSVGLNKARIILTALNKQ